VAIPSSQLSALGSSSPPTRIICAGRGRSASCGDSVRPARCRNRNVHRRRDADCRGPDRGHGYLNVAASVLDASRLTAVRARALVSRPITAPHARTRGQAVQCTGSGRAVHGVRPCSARGQAVRCTGSGRAVHGVRPCSARGSGRAVHSVHLTRLRVAAHGPRRPRPTQRSEGQGVLFRSAPDRSLSRAAATALLTVLR
jgi:hypothetical protein